MQDIRFLQFLQLIDVAQKSIKRIEVKHASYFGVKGVHVFWLYELSCHPEGLTSAELASKRGIDRSLVSREIACLKQDGLVEVLGDATRNYNVRLVLTERGKEAARRIGETAYEIQKLTDTGVSEEELIRFYATFEKLTENLKTLSNK